MHARRELWEVLLDLIPLHGAILADDVWARARAQGLTHPQIGAGLAYLYASDRAQERRRGGWSFVERVMAREAFPLVARPVQRPRPRRFEGRR